jgi:hypothetical protein
MKKYLIPAITVAAMAFASAAFAQMATPKPVLALRAQC